jgi:hypothetical protein
MELEATMGVLNKAEKRQLHGLLKKLGLFAAEARNNSKTTSRKSHVLR